MQLTVLCRRISLACRGKRITSLRDVASSSGVPASGRCRSQSGITDTVHQYCQLPVLREILPVAVMFYGVNGGCGVVQIDGRRSSL